MSKFGSMMSAFVVAGLIFSGVVSASETTEAKKHSPNLKSKTAHSTLIAQSAGKKALTHKFTASSAKKTQEKAKSRISKAKSKSSVNKAISKRTGKVLNKRSSAKTAPKKLQANAKSLMF